MKLTDILKSFGRSGLAALVAGGMACGDSGSSSSGEQTKGCVTDDDCHGGRVCEAGQCQDVSTIDAAPGPLSFCCGKIIHSPQGNSLSSFDVSLLESSPIEINSDFKPRHFANLRVASDFQKIVISTYYDYGPQAPFSIFDVNGSTFLPFRYISRGRQHSALGNYFLPNAQLLSDGVTLIAVLGDDFDGGEGELAIPRSQLYLIRENEIPQPLTSVTSGVRYVQSHVVFPDDTIYFFGHTPQDERHLFRTDTRGSRIDVIPSSSELPASVDSMYRLVSGQILARSFSSEQNMYIVNSVTGDWHNLGIDATPQNNYQNGIIVSPTKNQFVYQQRRAPNVSMSVLYDVDSGQKLELSQEQFPSCPTTSCFSFVSGVWLP